MGSWKGISEFPSYTLEVGNYVHIENLRGNGGSYKYYGYYSSDYTYLSGRHGPTERDYPQGDPLGVLSFCIRTIYSSNLHIYFYPAIYFDPCFPTGQGENTFVVPSSEIVVGVLEYELFEMQLNYHNAGLDRLNIFNCEPHKEGYVFDGWYTAKTGGEKVTESTTYTDHRNIDTLYAHWLTPCTVEFDPSFPEGEGATTLPSPAYRTFKSGDTYTFPTEPTKQGYEFVGWFTAKDNPNTPAVEGTQVTTSTTVRESNHSIYGHWRALAYTLALQFENPSVSKGQTTIDVTYADTGKTENDVSALSRTELIPVGTTITISDIKPAPGLKVSSVKLQSGATISGSGGTYTFDMPSRNDTIVITMALDITDHLVRAMVCFPDNREYVLTTMKGAGLLKYGYAASIESNYEICDPTISVTHIYFPWGCEMGLIMEARENLACIGFSVGDNTAIQSYGTTFSYTFEKGNNETIYVWFYELAAEEFHVKQENGVFYMEEGELPQTRVTDQALIETLNTQFDYGNASNSVFGFPFPIGKEYLDGSCNMVYSVYEYEGKKYAHVQTMDNWYYVEPIRWLVDVDKLFPNGSGNAYNFTVVSEKVLLPGAMFTIDEFGWGMEFYHYTQGNFGQRLNVFALESGLSLYGDVEKDFQCFEPDGQGLVKHYTDKEFQLTVASLDEVRSVGTKAKLTDFAKDILGVNSDYYDYWTRDLGGICEGVIVNKLGAARTRWLDQTYGVRLSYSFYVGSYVEEEVTAASSLPESDQSDEIAIRANDMFFENKKWLV